jgi:hypothetical protein
MPRSLRVEAIIRPPRANRAPRLRSGAAGVFSTHRPRCNEPKASLVLIPAGRAMYQHHRAIHTFIGCSYAATTSLLSSVTFATGAISRTGKAGSSTSEDGGRMFYPQSNFQGSIGNSQGFGYPQGFGNPQGFGYPQGGFGQPGFPGISNNIPFANTLYGYPQLTPSFAQGLPHVSNWQHPAQQQAQQQAALQQQAMLHLQAAQLAQPFTQQHLQGANAFAGLANGATQSPGLWQQPQTNPEQINAALLQQSQPQMLQRLAQYHHLVAQQLAQLAAQQATQGPGASYVGQFIPSQFVSSSGQYIANPSGANFVPGITMH